VAKRIRSKKGLVQLSNQLVELSPTKDEYSAGMAMASEKEREFKRSRGELSPFEKNKHESFSRRPEAGKRRGKQAKPLDVLQEKGKRLLLPFQNGCFTDHRCTAKRKRGLFREWMGCDNCGAFFHYGCALAAKLFVAPKGKEVDIEKINFLCEACQDVEA
jgi:hypothetical protein